MTNPIETIKQKIEDTIYGYVEGEFMPIRVDGQVANWDAFAFYKAEKAAKSVERFASRSLEISHNVASVVFNHLAEQTHA